MAQKAQRLVKQTSFQLSKEQLKQVGVSPSHPFFFFLKVEKGWETLNRGDDGSLRGKDGKVGGEIHSILLQKAWVAGLTQKVLVENYGLELKY